MYAVQLLQKKGGQKMNLLKKGLAVLLSAAICIPSVPAAAEDLAAGGGQPQTTADPAAEKELVTFNTGSFAYCVVDQTVMQELAASGADGLNHYVAYRPDGSYQIQVEEDAFFPYEVQFTYDGKTSSEWFMTRDDQIEVGGHTFCLDAPASGEVVTQMQVRVGGDSVVVYPEKKEFTNDENSQTQPSSLLPLKERHLTVDFNDYTPVELTKVSFASVFQGETQLPEGTSVMWKRSGSGVSGDYQTNLLSDRFDVHDFDGSGWEMILGAKDQLSADNIRYFIKIDYYSESSGWLTSSVYKEDGGRKAVASRCSYIKMYNQDLTEKSVVQVGLNYTEQADTYFLGLELNPYLFPSARYAQMKVYDGKLTEEELQNAPDLTPQIWNADPAAGGGFPIALKDPKWITFASYNSNGDITGCLPVELSLYRYGRYANPDKFYQKQDDGTVKYIYPLESYHYEDGVQEYTYDLTPRYSYDPYYPADGQYTQTFKYANGEGKIDNDSSDLLAAYIGKWNSIEEAANAGAADVKADLFGDGYTADYSNGVTFSIFIANVHGSEPVKNYFRIQTVADPKEDQKPETDARVGVRGLYDPQSGKTVSHRTSSSLGENGTVEYTQELEKEYALDGQYRQSFSYYQNGSDQMPGDEVTAYIGRYGSAAEAANAGAENIKDQLFGDGYTADYSKGMTFSIFIGPDGDPNQSRRYYIIRTERYLNSGASANFTGIVMRGDEASASVKVPSYIVGSGFHNYDSYGDDNFFTFYIDRTAEGKEVDLASLALTFTADEGAKLYAQGTNAEEISGQSFHDFSGKALQFTATSEDGKNQKNYFIRVVKRQDETDNTPAALYINSLEDENSKTREENGVIYSTREVFLDSYHNNRHDILVSNIGYQTMSALSVSAQLTDLQLDDYWTLTGNYGLSGFTAMQSGEQDRSYGQLSNLALVRLKANEQTEAKEYGELGTLTFASDGKPVMVLTLTGIVGDPRIVIKELVNPTKYVPYGTMIMNNNKYDWNHVSYKVVSGKLPEGMSLTPSGELYGVPKEAGDFEFTVRLDNSAPLQDDTKTFQFTVLENTDTNVDNAEDMGYKLTKRISGISDVTANGDYLIISEGVFDEYTDLYIDGELLKKDEDYAAESGSTRITIAAQSLPKSEGTHTIGVEFRQEKSRGKVKVAAQNYQVKPKNNSNSSSGGSSSGSWGGGSPSGGSSTSGNTNQGNPQKPGTTNPPAPVTPPTVTPAPVQPKPDTGADVSDGADTSVSKTLVYARTYTVKDGDTLKSLAKKYYGKSSKWKKIYNANKKKIPASQKLKKGMKLTIPAISYTVKKGDTIKTIAKKYFGANSKWKLIYQVNQDVIPSSLKLKTGSKLVIPVPVVCRIYTVKSNDTLEKIAKKFYGKTSKWKKIYNANKNKVTASKKVKKGTSLFIPAMTYTVKKGDDIKSIAKNYYGAKSEWRQIYDANKDVIPSSKKLKAGTTLVLPVPVDLS